MLLGQGDGGEKGALYIFNPLAHAITEALSLPVPVCAVIDESITTDDAATPPTWPLLSPPLLDGTPPTSAGARGVSLPPGGGHARRPSGPAPEAPAA